jgi:hypothetical protein
MPTEILIETVSQYLANEHDLFATCPKCHGYKQVDVSRLIAKGLGDKLLRDLRLSCGTCSVQVNITVVPRVNRTMVMDPTKR